MNHFICEGSDVPYVAINILTVHMAIVLVSFVNLIYFFISGFRIEKILSRVSASSLRAGELLSSNLDTDLSHKEQMVVPSNAYKVMADESGYVTHFRLQNLASLAEKMDVCIRYRHQIGDFVTTGTVLCYVWDAQTRKDEEREGELSRRVIQHISYDEGDNLSLQMRVEGKIVTLLQKASTCPRSCPLSLT
jgi:uncharacterized membrane protein